MKIKSIFLAVSLLSFFWIGSILAIENSERIYSITLEYNKGSLNLKEINLITGFPNLSADKTVFLDQTKVYELELLSSNGGLLHKGYFDISNIVYPAPPQNPGEAGEETGPIELDKVTFGLTVPYFKNGQTIRIAKDDKELLTIDVSKFQMYCGDGKCQSDENHQTCPQDCVGQKETPPTLLKEGKKFTDYILYGGIIIGLAILVALIITRPRKKNVNIQ